MSDGRGYQTKTAAELDSYRLLFKQQKLVRKNMRNWLGGTYDIERLAILRFLTARAAGTS